jgi:hypothetical protein
MLEHSANPLLRRGQFVERRTELIHQVGVEQITGSRRELHDVVDAEYR